MRMTLVDETASHGARPGVEVFVAAPGGKIGAAVVQVQFEVAGSVGQVEADHAALRVPEPGDFLEVEGLAAAVLHAGQSTSAIS
jgi:hypothetical protein